MHLSKFLLLVLTLFSGFILLRFTYSYFSNAASSTNNTFTAASVFPTPSPTPIPIAQTLVINEVLPVSSCADANKNTNWIELWNGTASTVNLKNFKISDGTNITDLVNSNTNLNSHSFALIAKDGSIFNHGTTKGNKCYPDNNAVTANLGNTSPVSLSNGTIKLLQSDGTTVIDKVQFNGTFNGRNLSPATDQSIERSPTGLDSALGDTFIGTDFVIRTTPTPGL